MNTLVTGAAEFIGFHVAEASVFVINVDSQACDVHVEPVL